jgi:hypothetical protein
LASQFAFGPVRGADRLGTMTIDEAARRWASTWERAWVEKDVDAILELYSDAVVYSSEPFRRPYLGLAGAREYIRRAFSEEGRIRAVFGQPVVGENGASICWWATIVENGAEITLAGTSSLLFDHDGLVIEQWDTWNQAPGWVQTSGWPFGGRR